MARDDPGRFEFSEGGEPPSIGTSPGLLGYAPRHRHSLDDSWRLHGGLIGSRYEVINELARGTTGAVFRALDRLTGHVVILKRLRMPASSATEPLTGDAALQERLALAQEFRLLASLRHPNIISVLDYGFDGNGHPYFSMDQAENALTIIEAGANQPIAVQIELLVQTLRALAYLHRHGIIHRDLKPANIVVTGGQVKVLDLGLSVSPSDVGECGISPGLWATWLPSCCVACRRASGAICMPWA